jgi:CDP-paratose 2-epimerase
MKLLITGICGFVGKSLVECLLERHENISICGIDNLMRPGSELNRTQLRRLGATVVHGDLRVASDFESLPAVDWVIDAAANPSVLAGLQGTFSSRQLFEHNLAGLVNVLEYCRIHRASLVLLSTSRVYSISALCSIPLTENGLAFRVDKSRPFPVGATGCGIGPDFSTAAPVSLYGSTKLASEAVALEYGCAFDFRVWIDRCGVLAGPGQFGTPDQGIFSYWINGHLRKRALRYIGFGGSGKQVRDALHPRDLSELLDRQMREERAAGRRVYTVGGGTGNAMSLAELTAWCDDKFGTHVPTADLSPRPYDIPWVVMDNQEAESDFGWRPEISMETLLTQIASHAESNADWLERSGL